MAMKMTSMFVAKDDGGFDSRSVQETAAGNTLIGKAGYENGVGFA